MARRANAPAGGKQNYFCFVFNCPSCPQFWGHCTHWHRKIHWRLRQPLQLRTLGKTRRPLMDRLRTRNPGSFEDPGIPPIERAKEHWQPQGRLSWPLRRQQLLRPLKNIIWNHHVLLKLKKKLIYVIFNNIEKNPGKLNCQNHINALKLEKGRQKNHVVFRILASSRTGKR